MVFPGKFSTGCRRCRQRKVKFHLCNAFDEHDWVNAVVSYLDKCDEAKPSCRRCYIYGKPCTGYTDQFHFRFDNSAVKQRSTSSSQQRASAHRTASFQPQESSHKQQPSNAQNILQASTGLSAPRSHPEISYDQVSLCYFVRRFVTPDDTDSFPGHLSFLPSLYSHQGHGLLEVATLSVAQMAAYNQFGGDKFRLQSYQNYGRAVRALRKTIQSEEEVTDDRVISAVLLLCIFKDISGEGWGDPSEHASGLYYLLERRGIEQLCTRRGFELFLLALLKLQIHSFLHQDDSYSDPGGLVAWLSVFDPMMRAMSLMTRGLWLRHNLSKCDPGSDYIQESRDESAPSEQSSYSPNGFCASILRACFEALDDFDSWDSEAESYWKHTFEGRSVPAALGEIAVKVTYYDPETACTIILVRCARLILLSSIVEYYERMQQLSDTAHTSGINNQEAWAECIPSLKASILLTIDDMLWCVPFAMGDLNAEGKPVSMAHDGAAALTILQPLRLITFCCHATPEQRSSGQRILNRMNSTIGVRSAVPWDERGAHSPRGPELQGFAHTVETVGGPLSRQNILTT